jgi:hypothetical protein
MMPARVALVRNGRNHWADSVPVALLFLVQMSGCGQSSAAETLQERWDSAGVQIVRVQSTSHDLAWEFRERWRVGGADEGLTGFSRLSHWTVAAAPDGTVAVLDGSNHRVVLLDSDGTVISSYGRRGGGPGEMQRPAGLAVGSDGVAWVYDAGAGALLRFNADGGWLEPRRVESRVWESVRSGTDGVYLGERSVAGAEMTRSVVQVTANEEVRVFSTTVPRPAMVDVPGCGASIPIGRLFERDLAWDAEGARVAVFLGPEYVVDVYDNGHHTLSLRMSLPPRPVTEALAARYYGDGFRLRLAGGECRADPVSMVRSQGFEPNMPSVSALRVTQDGEIWVQRGHLPDEQAIIDIWAADGEYVGALPEGTLLPVAFLPDGGVAVSEVDQWDIPQLVVLSVNRRSARSDR